MPPSTTALPLGDDRHGNGARPNLHVSGLSWMDHEYSTSALVATR
jgi:predicted secreted hydrolase